MVWLSVVLPTLAYETDQLTDRQVPLGDSLQPANARLDQLLIEAVNRVNDRTRCKGDDARMKRKLAKSINRTTSANRAVKKRGLLGRNGFGVYTAWLEESPLVDRREFADRSDIYGDVDAWQSLILATVGTSSTIRIADTFVGTDKIDHFLDTGYWAWRKSGKGRKPDKGLKWSVRTEKTIYGLVTSKTFSYADLRANYDGQNFYDTLLADDSLFQRDEHGCVVQTAGWDWAAWLNWEYDEALNPSVHTAPVRKGLQARIGREPWRYCLAWFELGGPDYEAHLQHTIREEAPYFTDRMPERYDPYGLAWLCGGRTEEEP